jgi:hypothetical protein
MTGQQIISSEGYARSKKSATVAIAKRNSLPDGWDGGAGGLPAMIRTTIDDGLPPFTGSSAPPRAFSAGAIAAMEEKR